MITHLLLSGTSLLLWPYFFLLNRTTVTGRPREIPPNTLLVSNHQSSLDGYLIALAGLFPRCLICPRLMPWSLASAEYFFKTPLRAWFARRLRCIPVGAGCRATALRRMIRTLEGGVGIYFPEGGRSADGAIRPACPGVGLIVLKSRPRVIPVAIEGMGKAVRFDRFGLRFFRPIRISFGTPIDCDDGGGWTGGAADPQRIADDLMGRIARMHAALRDPAKEE